MQCPYGFRIVGATNEARRLVKATAALVGYASCDHRAETNREGYLSAFTFGDDFRTYLDEHQSTAGYAGPCHASWLWFDIDREGNLDLALADARRLVATLIDRYGIGDGELWPFFSGSKGFHVGIATAVWQPDAALEFHRQARRLCEALADVAGVTIDTGVYDRVRAFRAPNSRHPKTGLHKRPLSLDELMHLRADRIVALARTPLAVDVPTPTITSTAAADDWQAAMRQVENEAAHVATRRATAATSLNRSTLEFIRAGAATGDRHRLLFSAAANLAEFGCSYELAFALLGEAALDSGLAPKEVRRQIECGLAKGATS